jgi:hypothetical protein
MMESEPEGKRCAGGERKKATNDIFAMRGAHENKEMSARGNYFVSRGSARLRRLPQKSLRPRTGKRAYIRRRFLWWSRPRSVGCGEALLA